MTLRVRRSRTTDVIESTPQRVRRTRPVIEPQEVEEPVHKARLTRTRPANRMPVRVRAAKPEIGAHAAASLAGGTRPYFTIDWSRPLSWKFSIYMVTSYLYYQLDRSMIEDYEFDRLCQELDAGYDDFEHIHKKFVDRGQFTAGTGYAIGEYPLMVQFAAHHLYDHHKER